MALTLGRCRADAAFPTIHLLSALEPQRSLHRAGMVIKKA
jgi:hypothetical protein